MEESVIDSDPPMDIDIVEIPSNVETEEGEVIGSDQENKDDGFGWKLPDPLASVKRKQSLESESGSSDSNKKVRGDCKESIKEIKVEETKKEKGKKKR